MTNNEITQMAAEIGAKVALATLEKERLREQKEIADRRLRNTKLLLKNYRTIKDHAENAIFESEPEESPMKIMEELMQPHKSSVFVESIKRSATRTATIVRHIETMMQLYRTYCFAYGTAEDERRWRIIDGLYMSPDRVSVSELAEIEGVVERTIYKDIDIACERISALMFGIDGIKKR